MDDSLFQTVRDALYPCDDPRLQPFVERLRARFKTGLLAIVFYGSKLDPVTDTPTSFYDFYLISDSYRKLHAGSRGQALLNGLLPPNIYYEDLGAGMACKACSISLEQLREQVRPGAKDFYHRGRFSKRFCVAWAANQDAVDELTQIWLDASDSLLAQALVLCGNRFEIQDFSKALLKLSYLGEVRPETDDKIEQLYEAQSGFYSDVHARLLERFRRAHHRELGLEQQDGRVVYYQRRTVSARLAGRKQLERALKRSKRRAVARWPKQMMQVDNWLEIILAKFERTQGEKLELTARQRRHPLLLGWPLLLRLKRQGKIK
ncbi:MAG: hypothetical protein P9M14_12055 [Candidatus Alcyoniella australis]|nr:hypothetical protein [Candidatus Alcyoniella australis]